MAGASGALLAANGLRIVLTTPDTTLITAVTTLGDIAFGGGAAVGWAFGACDPTMARSR